MDLRLTTPSRFSAATSTVKWLPPTAAARATLTQVQDVGGERAVLAWRQPAGGGRRGDGIWEKRIKQAFKDKAFMGRPWWSEARLKTPVLKASDRARN
jgi:hypothetical protein